MADIIDPIDVEGFIGIESHNDDVDTDRGVWRQRWFEILFKTHSFVIGEEDFEAMITAFRLPVEHQIAEEKWQKEMEQEHLAHEKADENLSKILNPNPKHKRIAKEVSKMLGDLK
jgi:hypothetical protein